MVSKDIDKYNLDELKKQYEVLRNKYKLPSFSELNVLFDIEEISSDTELLLKKLRRVISDRISGYMRFIEILLNPSNAPMYFFKLIKKLDSSDIENLMKLYETMGKFELELIALDLDYSEKKEAEFIVKSYKLFNEIIKSKLLELIDKLIKNDSDKKDSERGYFG